MSKLMAILVIIFLCISCTDNAELPVKPDKNEGTENVLIELAVTVPAVTYTRTRGIVRTIDHETLINEIQILVFEEGKYKYRVPGLSINNTASTITFTALLKSGDIPMKLLILANATDVVVADEPVVGDSEEMIKKKMNRKFDYLTSVFPMSGEYELPEGLKPTGTGTILGLKMLRSIARVDVTATEVANFRMTGVKAYRANNYLQVIPDETGVSKVTFPSVPEGSDRNVDSSIFPVSSENWNNFSARLYLSETWSPEPEDQVDKATCIVVEGYYADSNTPSYYRMDFDPDNNHNAFGQVLRNHKYIFNIKKVSAPGWSTPDDAAHNRSSNIVAEVQAWDDDTMDMYFDGEHHFGISTREVVLKHKTGSEGIISVSTDLLDYTLQWADDAGVLQGTGAQSLSNDYFTVTKEDNGSRLVITALQNNLADGSNRIQHFVITAQRWTIYVSIQQKYDIAAYKTINWESIVLIAAMLPMSLALEKTGASEYISNTLVNGLGSYGPVALMAGIYFTTSLMTMFISNTATAVLLAPIALQSAIQLDLSPYPFLFAVTVAASMCFASPFSTPPNALVMPAGRYTFMDYVKVGLPLQIIMGIVMIFVLPLLFPF